MRIKNLILAIKEQGFKEFFITRNAWGLFFKSSHINKNTNKEKVSYHTKESAVMAAAAMSKKYSGRFAPYKCIFCDNWHIGKSKK